MRNYRAVSSYQISIQAGSRPVGGITNLADGIPSLSAEHMDNFGNVLSDKMKFIPRDFFDRATRGKIQKGDVLVRRKFSQLLYGEKHPYGLTVVDNDFDRINISEIKDFFSPKLVKFRISGLQND